MDEKVNVHIAPFLATRSTYSLYSQPMSDKIFFRQAEIIRSLAEQGACVFVGRCADYILENHPDILKVFLYGNLEDRIARKQAMNLEISEADMARHVQATDRKRARYYRHYTGKLWGDRKNYDICLNTSLVGIEGTVALLKEAVIRLEACEQ